MRKGLAAICCMAFLPLTAFGQAAAPAPSPAPATAPTTAPMSFPKIDRYPSKASWNFGRLTALPVAQPGSQNPFELDLRCRDISTADLRNDAQRLLSFSFDDQTTFPPADRMPKDFDPKQVMDIGKNPGLGLRALHARGITGKGVGIGMVDQVMIVDHQEYKDRLRLYEEIGIIPWMPSEMHGPAVASLVVGNTVGVAPEADLYYIASLSGVPSLSGGPFRYDFTSYAKSVRRLLEINRQLPQQNRIRVIAMQIGWSPSQTGYEDMMAACDEAKAQGMLVVSSSLEQVHGFKFHGLGRPPLADPDKFESYEPGSWWAQMFWNGNPNMAGRLLVPMDSRTTAAPNGRKDYAFYRQGGWSWSIPYIAGAYALACQVDPAITPDRFWQLAMKTGRTTTIEHDGKKYQLGPILDMGALVGALK